jgi:hypothetical protein
MHHPSPPQGADYDAFVKVAQKSEDATFLETTDADVAKAAGLSAAGVVVLTNFAGEDRVVAPLKGKVTDKAIEVGAPRGVGWV